MRRVRWFALALVLFGCGPVRQRPEPDIPLPEVITAVAQPAGAERTISSGPFGAGQVWTGAYSCARGESELRLIILEAYEYKVQALFDFRHVPTGASGTYLLDGVIDPTRGRVRFRPQAWIARSHDAQDWELAGMVGAISDDRIVGSLIDPAAERIVGAFDVRL